jgi:predicted Zn-dependent peptidase
MAEEGNMSLMLALGKSMLDLDRVESLPEIFDRIDALSAHHLQDVAQLWLHEDNFTTLIYQPQPNQD